VTARPLTLVDIVDLRAYERERDDFRRSVIAEKRVRRVTVGSLVTLNFESRTTVRFQVQEMARAEKLTTDAQIQHELDIYNRLLPSPGELSATLFLELTTEEQLQTWLPRLVGVEHSGVLLIGEGSGIQLVRSVPEEDHEMQLTRVDVTSAVHYVRFPFTPGEISVFAAGPATLIVNHPEYPEGRHGVLLSDATRAALSDDLTAT
jgi:hypothetical protein